MSQHPMIDVPFPLSNGTTAWLRYPKYGWTDEDVERFTEFVRASMITVTREPAQAGDSE